MKAFDLIRKIINPKSGNPKSGKTGSGTGGGKYADREIRDSRGNLQAVKLAEKGERVSRAERIARFTEWKRDNGL
jgi:hypothetical protein